MNEAKNELRNIVQSEMVSSWIHKEAQNRAFKGSSINLKKEVFERYMVSFR